MLVTGEPRRLCDGCFNAVRYGADRQAGSRGHQQLELSHVAEVANEWMPGAAVVEERLLSEVEVLRKQLAMSAQLIAELEVGRDSAIASVPSTRRKEKAAVAMPLEVGVQVDTVDLAVEGALR